jgi:hypothetical protein
MHRSAGSLRCTFAATCPVHLQPRKELLHPAGELLEGLLPDEEEYEAMQQRFKGPMPSHGFGRFSSWLSTSSKSRASKPEKFATPEQRDALEVYRRALRLRPHFWAWLPFDVANGSPRVVADSNSSEAREAREQSEISARIWEDLLADRSSRSRGQRNLVHRTLSNGKTDEASATKGASLASAKAGDAEGAVVGGRLRRSEDISAPAMAQRRLLAQPLRRDREGSISSQTLHPTPGKQRWRGRGSSGGESRSGSEHAKTLSERQEMQEMLLRERVKLAEVEDWAAKDGKGVGEEPLKKGPPKKKPIDSGAGEDLAVGENSLEEATTIKFAKKDLVTELANHEDGKADEEKGGICCG